MRKALLAFRVYSLNSFYVCHADFSISLIYVRVVLVKNVHFCVSAPCVEIICVSFYVVKTLVTGSWFWFLLMFQKIQECPGNLVRVVGFGICYCLKKCRRSWFGRWDLAVSYLLNMYK